MDCEKCGAVEALGFTGLCIQCMSEEQAEPKQLPPGTREIKLLVVIPCGFCDADTVAEAQNGDVFLDDAGDLNIGVYRRVDWDWSDTHTCWMCPDCQKRGMD